MKLLHYFKLYLALVAFLTTTWGIVVESYLLVEAAFKAAFVMLALIAFEYAFKLQVKKSAALSLTASMIIVLFYSMNVGGMYMNVVVIAYICLVLLILISFGKPERVYSFIVEELPLYYVASAFYWLIGGGRDMALSTTALAVLLAVSIVKTLAAGTCITRLVKSTIVKKASLDLVRVATELHLLREVRTLSKFKAGLEAVWRAIRYKMTLFLEFLQSKAMSGAAAVSAFKEVFSEFIKTSFKVEDKLLQSVHKLAELVASLVKGFVKVEKRVEKIFHTVSSAIEMLQYSMEHSFLLLLFLMSILLLAAMLFYITFTALH